MLRAALIGVVLLWAQTFVRTASADPLAQLSADVDGDGKADRLTVEQSGTLRVTRAATNTPIVTEAAIGTPGYRIAGATLDFHVVAGGHRTIAARLALVDDDEGSSAQTALFVYAAGKLVPLWSGATGPQGEERDWTREVELADRGIVLYETRSGVSQCDGAPAHLYEKGWDWNRREFRTVKLTPAAPSGTPIVATRVTPSGLDATVKPTILRFQAASTDAQDGGSAEGLTVPTELDDGDVRTVWSEAKAGGGVGEFFTARASATGFDVVALRMVPGDASSAPAFQAANRLKLVRVTTNADPNGVLIAFDKDPAEDAAHFAEPYWVPFATPLAATCVSVEILEVYPPRVSGGKPANRTAISEFVVLTDLDAGGAKALADLAESVAKGDAKAADAEHLLAAHGGAGVRALLDAIAANGRTPIEQRRLRRALAARKDPAGAAEVLAGLADEGTSETDVALLEAGLAGMGAGALPALTAALADDKLADRARIAAAKSLAPIAAPTARTALVDACGKGTRPLRHAVAFALGARDPSELPADVKLATDKADAPVDDLPEGLRECEADLWRAAGLLAPRAAAAARTEASAAIAARLAHADLYELRYRLVAAAAACLPETTAHDALDAVFTNEKEPALREVAAQAIAARADASDVNDLLARAVADADPGVRLAALPGLAAHEADATADAPLAGVLSSDAWPAVRRAAADALAARCGRSNPADALYAAAGGDADEDVRRAALAALVRCHEPRIGQRLVATANDKARSIELRAYAATLLGALGDRSLTPALIALFDDARRESFGSEEAIRLAAACARALGALGDARAASPLFEAAQDGSFPAIQAAAADALATLCPAGTTAVLQKIAHADDAQVVRAARLGLKRCSR